MPRKLSITFHHDTGPRCIVSLEENGPAVRVTYSLRCNPPIPVDLADSYLADWQAWSAQMMKMPAIPPALPSGWR
jgi:hypothetical protein